MAYRFKLNRRAAQNIRRIGLEQIDLAIRNLGGGKGRHKSVHQARKGVKRMRALLRLARFVVGEETFKEQNRRFRDIARGLSGARDKQAMIECVTKLQMRYGLEWNVAVVAGIKSWLYEQRRSAEEQLSNGSRPNAIAALGEARGEFASLQIEGDLKALIKGLADCYRRARLAHETCYATNVDEDFHEWRKWMQQHWRQMQLLTPVWPEELAVRVDASREISQWLGDDHDLYVLSHLVRENAQQIGDAPDIARFLSGCEERQTELRLLAQNRGARLLAEPPKPFSRRMKAYWSASRKISQDDLDIAEEVIDLEEADLRMLDEPSRLLSTG